MAKVVSGFLKLQVRGGQANPAPPVGPALGSKGINIMEFCNQGIAMGMISWICLVFWS